MRNYDRSEPLIVIHIPKAAGSSAKQVFKRWYGDQCHQPKLQPCPRQAPESASRHGRRAMTRPLPLHQAV